MSAPGTWVELAPPVYPPRDTWRRGDRPEALRDLERWINGGTFHQYGRHAHDVYGLEAVWEHPGELEVKGEMCEGRYVRWSIYGKRAGSQAAAAYVEGRVFCSGYSDPNHAAYTLLSLAEGDERASYLDRLVVGLA